MKYRIRITFRNTADVVSSESFDYNEDLFNKMKSFIANPAATSVQLIPVI